MVSCCFSYHYKSFWCDILSLPTKGLGPLLPGALPWLPLSDHSAEKKMYEEFLVLWAEGQGPTWLPAGMQSRQRPSSYYLVLTSTASILQSARMIL